MQESKISYLDTVDELNLYLNKNLNNDTSIIFVDSNVKSEYEFDENYNIHEVLVNEETKNITTVEKIWEIMHSNSATRSTNIIYVRQRLFPKSLVEFHKIGRASCRERV